MHIYLAGPMRGHPGQNHAAFHEWTAKLRDAGHTVFNPAEHSPTSPSEADSRIRSLIGADLAWITSTADAVALLPGWKTSLGVAAERATAQAIGIPVDDVRQFLISNP
jgi:nucleoside 2-deoxyribosyltransferase